MLDQSPTPPSPPHVVGEGYDFQKVRAQLGGEATPPSFVIHREDRILGLCLGLMWHPLAESDPGEVWVGRKGDLPKWGRKLAETTGALPVYVRREEGGKWFYTGLFEVTANSTEPEAIKQRLKPPVITAISRIIFLKPYDPSRPQVAAMEHPPALDASPSGPPADQAAAGAIDEQPQGGEPAEVHRATPAPVPDSEEERVHPRDPLHGVTLETIVTKLLERHGWAEMARRIPIRCFQYNPSVKSSLTFLRKNLWARHKVEAWFISEL